MSRVLHIGLFKIKPDVSVEISRELQQRVAEFKQQIAGIIESYCGPRASFNFPQAIVDTYCVDPDTSILARGYTWVLYILFASEHDRIEYDNAQPHMDLSTPLFKLLEHGMDDVLTFDLVLPNAD